MDGDRSGMPETMKKVRRVVVFVVGVTVLAVGAAMIVLPGPAIVVIPLGLAILASEFVWAKKILDRVKRGLRRRDFVKAEHSRDRQED